jgi:hypothetical protein
MGWDRRLVGRQAGRTVIVTSANSGKSPATATRLWAPTQQALGSPLTV